MTTFRIDLTNPGEFARSWQDWFVGPSGAKRLKYSYIGGALAILAIVAYVVPMQYDLVKERDRVKQLNQKITQRQKDLANQRTQFQGIIELGKFEVVWSDVLVALSRTMPNNVWLRSMEFVEQAPAPRPQAVAPKEGQKATQMLRLVLVTTLRPGATHLVDINKFLNDLAQDPGFKRFQLQDWEVSLAKEGAGDKGEQQIVTSVTFRLV